MKTPIRILVCLTVASPALAQGGDDCAHATPIGAAGAYAFDTTAATTSGFDGTGTCDAGASTINQDLFWQFTVPADGDYTFDTIGSTFDTMLSVHEGLGCLSICLGHNDDIGNGNRRSRVNVTGLVAGQQLLIQVGGFDQESGVGTLNATDFSQPCGALSADLFEDNDDCPSAAPISNIVVSGLNVSDVDIDFYTFTLNAGETLTSSILFEDAVADLDLYLWDPAIVCDSRIAGLGTANGSLALGFSASDDELITYTNQGPFPLELVLEVSVFSPTGAVGLCNTYDLIVGGLSGGSPIGMRYCTAAPNSTGAPGRMTATGSAVAQDNDVTLGAQQLPPGTFGLFLASQDQGFSPVAGSQGFLCLSGTIGRFMLSPDSVFQTNPGGEAFQAIDLTAIPNGSVTVGLLGGMTWNFQAWHRDLAPDGTASSNFSDAIEIEFM